MVLVREDVLQSVVQSAMAPLQQHIEMARDNIKHIMGSMTAVRQVMDTQGQAVDRLENGMTAGNVNVDKACGAKDLTTEKKKVNKRVENARRAKQLLAEQNYKSMEAARTVFKQDMKEDIELSTVSSRVYPSSGANYEETARAIMEVHEMKDKEANEYTLSVRFFPKRDKVNLKEARVSALILSSKSHIGQQIKNSLPLRVVWRHRRQNAS
eukprot:TRINITY_DN17703_c0_g1_i1.p1 TRINITY_DN17703_c0_g1~~TRINITY_DN17703_c0_g1_i1.p1  ORF type:complete len:211 (+),score=60.07 TRINITY_DN17703_c0_g1_i1:271-903(+)